MEMEWQTIINSFGAIIVAGAGWFAHEIWDSMKELKNDLHKIEVDLPTVYATKASMESRFDKIDRQFEVLFERLNKLIEREIVR